MKRRTKKKPLPQPESIAYPAVVLRLAKAFQAGEACGPGLHDALLEAGHPGLAEHFAGVSACRPGTSCLAVEEILRPCPPDLDDATAEWPSRQKNRPRHRGYGQEDKDLSPDFMGVCRALESAGVAKAEVTYKGNGDSKAVESIVLYDRRGQEVEVARLPAWRFISASWPPLSKGVDLGEKLDELVCAILPGGWEINEGSFGTVTLNPLIRRIHVAHSWRIGTSNAEAFEHDL